MFRKFLFSWMIFGFFDDIGLEIFFDWVNNPSWYLAGHRHLCNQLGLFYMFGATPKLQLLEPWEKLFRIWKIRKFQKKFGKSWKAQKFVKNRKIHEILDHFWKFFENCRLENYFRKISKNFEKFLKYSKIQKNGKLTIITLSIDQFHKQTNIQ